MLQHLVLPSEKMLYNSLAFMLLQFILTQDTWDSHKMIQSHFLSTALTPQSPIFSKKCNPNCNEVVTAFICASERSTRKEILIIK